MEAIFLAVIILSGFIFSSECDLTKFNTKRLDGQHLSLVSTARGIIIFLLIAGLLYILSILNLSIYTSFADFFRKLFPVSSQNSEKAYMPLFALASILTFAFSIIGSFIINRFYGLFSKSRLYEWITTSKAFYKYTSDLFEKVIALSMSTGIPFMVIMTNGRVYIGYPNISFTPSRDIENEIKIKPTYLGYLGNDNKDVILLTGYKGLEELAKKKGQDIKSDLNIIIPKDKIVAMSLFEVGVFNLLKELNLQQPSNDNISSPMTHLSYTGPKNVSIVGKITSDNEITLEYKTEQNNGVSYSGPNNAEITGKENSSGEFEINYKIPNSKR